MHMYSHTIFKGEDEREDIFRIRRIPFESFEIERATKRKEKRNNERIRREGSATAFTRSRFKFPTRNIRTRSWVGAVNREGRNGSKICDKRVHVNATRYARRPQICDGPLYPWPGIGMCEVFPSASRSTRILQNKRVCVKFLFRGMGQGR